MEPAPELCVATVEAALGGVASAACLCIIWRCCRRRSPSPSIKEVDAQPFPDEEVGFAEVAARVRAWRAEKGGVDDAADALASEAIARGNKDNTTVCIVELLWEG